MKDKRIFWPLMALTVALIGLVNFVIFDDSALAAAIRERIAIDTRDDSYVYSGADIIWFAGDHATESARVEGAYGKVSGQYGGFVAPTAAATATPVVLIQNKGVGNSFEIRNVGGTPVFSVDKDGAATYSGFSSGGGDVTGAVYVTAPTAATTATPGSWINNTGAANTNFEVRKASTPQFVVNNDGSTTSTGAGTWSGGQTVNNWGKVAAPTAVATATPGFVVDSLAVSNILEVRDAATPVFTVRNGGAVVSANGQTISAGGLTVTAGDVKFTNGWVNIGAQTGFVVVDTLPITPTGTYQSLTSTGAAACNTTNCIVNGTTAGDLLILRNDNASDAITIDGTGANVECKADVVLGADDTVWLMWNGADWICLANHDNS